MTDTVAADSPATNVAQLPARLTPEQIIDLRRRVLAGEEVSNEELRKALETLALTRIVSAQGVPSKTGGSTASIAPIKIDVSSAFAKFREKKQTPIGSASSGGEASGQS